MANKGNQGSPLSTPPFKNKKAQEEMVGFALIIIIVAIIMLVFLGFSLRSTQKATVENYEVESFIQSFLQYTTECENNVEKLSVQKLIFSCNNREICANGVNSCDVLKSDLSQIVSESWKIGTDRPVKGYELSIKTDQNQIILELKKGETTRNFKGASPPLSKGINVVFKAYY